jgi:hypothetical protein
MAEQIFPKGLRVWPPREGAPSFVKGKISIHLDTFHEWALDHLDDKGFVALDLKEARDGTVYASLNTWKKEPKSAHEPPYSTVEEINPDDIPF